MILYSLYKFLNRSIIFYNSFEQFIIKEKKIFINSNKRFKFHRISDYVIFQNFK